MPTISAASRQKGGIGLSVAIILISLLTLIAVLLDSARLYLTEREMQRVADLAALEAVGLGSLCATNSLQQSLETAEQSATRNGFSIAAPTRTLAVQVGRLSRDGQGRRTLNTASGQQNDALEVTVRQQVRPSLFAQIAQLLPSNNSPSNITLQSQATAQRIESAGLSVGSGLITVNSGVSPLLQPVLAGLLDGQVNLGALTYQGITSANIELLSFLQLLAADANLGSIEAVLGAQVQALPFVDVIADILDQRNILRAGLLGAELAQQHPVNLTLSELLGVQSGTPSEALKGKINLFDVLMAGAFAANQKNALALNLQIPNLSSVELQIIERPQFAYGPPGKDAQGNWLTEASTGQLHLVVRLNPNLSDLLSLAGNLLNAEVDLALRIDLAQARAALDTIQCSTQNGQPNQVTVDASTQTDAIRITRANNANANAHIRVTSGALTLLTLEIKAGGKPIIGEKAENLPYAINPAQSPPISPNPQTLYSGVALGLPPIEISSYILSSQQACNPLLLGLDCLLNNTLSSIFNVVTNALGLANSVVGALSSTVLQPLLSALGIHVGFAEVTLYEPQITPAQLVR